MDATQLNEAIHATIAKQILESLDTEARDALIHKTMVKALTDWDFKNAVNKAISRKAEEVAAELLQSEGWDTRIRQAVEQGMENYLQQLRSITCDAVKSMFHGTSDTYGGRASILNFWPKPKSE